MKEMSSYYIEMIQSRNHMIAEAALQGIYELLSRIDTVVLAPYIVLLLEYSMNSLQDERWPVRDAACVVTGIIAQKYTR